MKKKNTAKVKSTKPVATLKEVRNVAAPVEVSKGVPAEVDSIPLSVEEAEQIRGLDQKMSLAKQQLLDVELQLLELQSKKDELFQFLKAANKEMLVTVDNIAVSHGIELDATKDSRKWNLNTNEMIFRQVK